MQPLISASTLNRREKRLTKHAKRRTLRAGAQGIVDQYVVTPDRIQQEAVAKGRRKSRLAAFFLALCATMKSLPAMASGGAGGAADANGMFGTVKNTIEFLLQLLMGVGICFIAFGVISLAISFQSHDDSQKSKAIMAIVGGAIAICVRFVIVFIVGDNATAGQFLN